MEHICNNLKKWEESLGNIPQKLKKKNLLLKLHIYSKSIFKSTIYTEFIINCTLEDGITILNIKFFFFFSFFYFIFVERYLLNFLISFSYQKMFILCTIVWEMLRVLSRVILYMPWESWKKKHLTCDTFY
jgi:hypothetical protein